MDRIIVTDTTMHMYFVDGNQIREALPQRRVSASGIQSVASGINCSVCEVNKMANDPINPSHYTSGKVECIEAIEVATEGLSGFEAYTTGNILKYIWRWKRKNGIEDLKKAQWYLNKLIQDVDKGNGTGNERKINWSRMIPSIEASLGFELREWQREYLESGVYSNPWRVSGKTTAYCIKLALTHRSEPIKYNDIYKFRDEEHGTHYHRWFACFFLDIWERLKDAGLPVVEITGRGEKVRWHK